MNGGGLLAYGLRTTYQRGWWLPLLLPIFYLAAGSGDWRFLFEGLLPLVTVIYLVPVMVNEKEGGTWSLLLSYPVDRTRLFISKFVWAMAMASLSIVIAWILARGWGWPVSGLALVAVGPGALFLSGLGVLLGILSSSPVVPWFVPLGWWVLDFSTRGQFTGIFYLFFLSLPGQELGFWPNKVALSVVGLLLWGLALGSFRNHVRG